MNLNLDNCNKEQLEFIKSDLDDCCLIGIPGGGKTTTIIKKILYHIDNKTISNKGFLIITFSKKACHDFISRGENIVENIFNKNNVKTIHSLAGTIINKIDKSKSDSIEIVICKALNYINQYTEEELIKIKCFSNLQVIIIDEAQDISELQYNLAKTIADKIKCKLILVGDPNQNIYQFQNGTDKFLLEHSKNKFYLKQNYRSTPEIINLVNSLKPWKNIIPDIVPTNKSIGKKPIIYSSSIKNILEHMIETIDDYKKNNIDLKDVAIIGPVKKSKENQYGKYNNIGLQYFVNYFEENKIPYVKHYSESTNDCEIVNSKTYSKEGHINLYTIHGSKGLEFKKVFLLNFHTSTYGRNPTSKDYNNFRYLWYVGLSRACDDMIIYCDYNKNVWYELAKCDPNLYKFMGKQIKFIEPIFEKNTKRSSSITELLKTKELFTEEFMLELKESIGFEIVKENIFDDDFYLEELNIENFDEYSSLYGKYIEQVFEYYYCVKNKKKYMLCELTKNFINNRISISNKYKVYLPEFLAKVKKNPTQLLELQFINEIKNEFNEKEKEIFEEICEKVKEKKIETFSIYIPNELIYDNPDEILTFVNNIENNINVNYNLYLLILYFYQYEHEAKYLWSQKESIHDKIKSSEIIVNNIMKYIDKLENIDYEFQIPLQYKYINDFNGIMDIYDKQNNEIIELKFVKNVSLIHHLQVFFYNLIKNNIINNFENMYVINFYEGIKFKINITNKEKFNIFDLLLKLSKILNTKIRNLVIMYDLETTGLIEEDNNKYPEIIDRYFYDINLKCVIDEGLVQSTNKLPDIITKLTNITDDMLKKDGIGQKDFFDKFIELNDNFEEPTYLAHNGNHFDHKIMCHYGLLNYDKVKFLDTRQIIINFTRNYNKEVKGKLTEMYKTIMDKEPLIAHRAEADVKLVVDILNKLDIKNKMKLN